MEASTARDEALSFDPLVERILPAKVGLCYLLIAVNVLVWLLGTAIARKTGLPGIQIEELAKDRLKIVQNGEFWRLLTANFVHANFLHLAVNMYSLYSLGRLIEPIYGGGRFLAMYMISGLGAMAASAYFVPAPAVGASGAICGLFGAVCVFSVIHRRFIVRGSVWKLWLNIVAVVAIMVYLGIVIPNIDNVGHAGGFVVGVVLALFAGPRTTLNAWSVRRRAATALWIVVPVALLALSLLKVAQVLYSSWDLSPASVPLVRRTLDEFAISIELPERITEHRRKDRREFVSPDGYALWLGLFRSKYHPDSRSVAESIRKEVEDKARPGSVGLTRAPLTRDSRRVSYEIQEAGRIIAYQVTVMSIVPGDYLLVTCAAPRDVFERLAPLFERILNSITPEGQQEPASDETSALRDGIELLQEGHFEEARGFLQEATRSKDTAGDAYAQLARLYLSAEWKERDPMTALFYAQKALDLSKKNPQLLLTLARALKETGDSEKAASILREAAAEFPDDASLKEELNTLTHVGANP